MADEITFNACFSNSGNPIQFGAHGAGYIKLEVSEDELAETAKLLLLLRGKAFKVTIPLEDLQDVDKNGRPKIKEPKQKRTIKRRTSDT